MGKFKEMVIEIAEAAEASKRAKKLFDMENKPEECNCDQAIQLKADLQIAINFGVDSEDHIQVLSKLVSHFVEVIIEAEIYTIEDLDEKFGITMHRVPTKDELH